MELTQNQKNTLEFIQSHIESTGVPPTLREIAAHFKWKAVGSAQDVVAALRKKGLLQSSSSGKARQILVTKAFKNVEGYFKVPLLGYVQAGLPLEAIAQPTEYAIFPTYSQNKLSSSELFALKVEGYSMINAGFLPGDLILVESSSSARDKEIVVACVNYSEVTVKRFAQKGSVLYKEAHKEAKVTIQPPAFLVAENPDFAPLPFGTQEQDKIVGVVRSLFRKSIN